MPFSFSAISLNASLTLFSPFCTCLLISEASMPMPFSASEVPLLIVRSCNEALFIAIKALCELTPALSI